MALNPITLTRATPDDGPLREALVREMLARTRASGAALIGATLLLWLIVRDSPAAPSGAWFLALAGITALRTLGTGWVERRSRGELPYMRLFYMFLALGSLIGLMLGALVLLTYPRLPPHSVMMCSVVFVGIDFGAMVSLAASPTVFFCYVSGNVITLAVASFVSPVAGAEHVAQAMQLVFAGSLVVMSRSVHLSLRSNLELRIALARSLTELQDTQAMLVAASRQAGRADVATAVIHNVGNALNSVNVSASVVSEAIAGWRSAGLARVVALLEAHQGDLAGFFTRDPRGAKIVGYLAQLVEVIEADKRAVTGELQSLVRNIEHIRAIVRSQQDQVQPSDVAELCQVDALLEDAIKYSAAARGEPDVAVRRRIDELPAVMLDRHKALQIVMNLLANAHDAVRGNPAGQREIVVGARRTAAGELEISVEDNGGGIAPADLARIFALGFTTKPDGHGLGLHYSACAARELGGSLTATSPGAGRGASFRLVLPVAVPRPTRTSRASAAAPIAS